MTIPLPPAGRRILDIVAIVALLASAALAAPAWAQKAYPTPEVAAEALIDGVARNDDAQVKLVLGADFRKYVPTREGNREEKTDFLAGWARAHRIIRSGDDSARVEIGTQGWTLPIPLVRFAEGWAFDTRAVPDELRTRRIGRNELDAIEVTLAYTDAQDDYAQFTRQHDGAPYYAQRMQSSPGKKDGLYWPTLPGEPESPFGAIPEDVQPDESYHGYRYRILTGQGEAAPGGRMRYVQNGRMIGGYALVAWPAKWGETGVMTFIVNQDGIVYQKDLGPRTDALARAITSYDPGPSWHEVSRR